VKDRGDWVPLFGAELNLVDLGFSNNEFVDVSWFMTLFTLGIMVGLRLNVPSPPRHIHSHLVENNYYVVD
jgi:hypothetical protein